MLQLIVYQIRLIFNIIICLFIFSIFCYTVTYNISAYDLELRIISSDSIINYFNFFWTSITYLVPFSLVLLYLISQFYSNLSNLYVWILLLFITLFFLEVSDNLIFNYTIFNISYVGSDFNTLLSNNLNKYHPYLLYSSAFFILLSSSTYFLGVNFKSRYNSLIYVNKYFNYNYKSLLWSTFALFLGSWWALQEGTWGGWWNWDTSEVLGLTILLFSLVNLHSYPSNFNYPTLRWKGYTAILSIINFFIILQLNFEITSHSFGSRLSYFFNTNLLMLNFSIFVSILLLTTYLYSSNLLNKLNLTLPKNFNLYNPFNFYLLWFYLLLLLIVTINTVAPLFNYYIWKFLELNYFNIDLDISMSILYLTLLLILLVSFNRYCYYYLIPFLIFSMKLPLFFFLLLIFPYLYSYFYILHFFILSLFYANYFFNTFDITSSNYDPNNLLIPNSEYNLYSNLTTRSCSNYLVLDIYNSYSEVSFKYKSYNFFYKSNSVKLNTFNLLFDTQSILNLYQNLNLIYLKSLSFELTSLDLLANIFIIFIFIFTYLYFKSYRSLTLTI